MRSATQWQYHTKKATKPRTLPNMCDLSHIKIINCTLYWQNPRVSPLDRNSLWSGGVFSVRVGVFRQAFCFDMLFKLWWLQNLHNERRREHVENISPHIPTYSIVYTVDVFINIPRLTPSMSCLWSIFIWVFWVYDFFISNWCWWHSFEESSWSTLPLCKYRILLQDKDGHFFFRHPCRGSS